MTEEKERADAIELLNRQLKTESELVSSYEETVKEIQNSAVRHILHMMILDSLKHIDICQAVVEILNGQNVLKAERTELLKGLQHHIKLEKGSIEVGNKLLKNSWIRNASGLQKLVKKFRDDEKEHHKTLERLSQSAFFKVDSRDFTVAWHDLDWLEERYKKYEKERNMNV